MDSTLHIPKTEEGSFTAALSKCRFVKVKFTDRENSKEYTYRVDPEASVRPGQYAITHRNMSKVTITAIDVSPVPGLAIEKYDFVDPVEDQEPT